MKFTEAKLEQAFVELLKQENIPLFWRSNCPERDEVLLLDELKNLLFINHQKIGSYRERLYW
jgi:hypothetical protein